MSRILIAYAAALVAIVGCDFAWLGFIAPEFYQAEIGSLLLPAPNWAAAALFYLLYPAGIVMFAIRPAHREPTFTRALGRGALFGLFAYGTYDLSNLATLAGWSVRVTTVDIFWGMAVSAVAATIGYYASRNIGR